MRAFSALSSDPLMGPRLGLIGVFLVLCVPLLSITAQESGDTPSQEPAAEEPSSPAVAENDSPAPADEQDSPESTEPVETGLKKVVYGKVDGEINMAESAFITRLLDQANQQRADVVLIELNTFGGRVDAAVAIRDALMDAPQETVVFINKRAISAGALISLACNRIAISPGATIGAAMPVSSNPGQEIPEAVQEKYLSYFRQEMRSTAETRGRNGDIAEALVDKDIEVPDISEKGKLLTLTTRTALETGMADFEADSVDAVLAEIGGSAAGLSPVDRSWSEALAAFLTSQAIASLLLLGMMLFGYLEYQTPGFGFFGAAAVACFVLLYFSHYLVNLAGHEELLLFAIGVMLIAAEVFIAPGAAIFATLGAMCILGSTIMLLMAGDWTDITLENPFTQEAMELVALSLVGSFVGMLAVARFFVLPVRGEGTRGGLLLQAQLSTEEGYQSHEPDPEAEASIGMRGKALTPLRPAGKARIDGRRVNVETEGEFVEKGEEIEVLRRVEGRLVVQKAGTPALQSSASNGRDQEEAGDA